MPNHPTTLGALMLLGLLSTSAAAAGPLSEGDRELTLTGALNLTPDFRFFSIGGSLGYMLTDRQEVGGILRYSRFSDDYGSSSGGSLGAFYHWNFPPRGKDIVPFVGGGGAFGFGDDAGVAGGSVVFSEPSAFGEVGIKWFLNKGAQVRVEYVAEHYFGDASLTSHGVIAGIALTF